MTKMNFVKKLAATVLLAGVAASANANYIDPGVFQVKDGSTAATAGGGSFSADDLGGQYKEIVYFGANGVFQSLEYWNLGSFSLGGETVSGTNMNQTYKLYAVMSSTGHYTIGTGGAVSFVSDGSDSLSLYKDANMNTTKAISATFAGGIVRTNTSDDLLLGTANKVSDSNGSQGSSGNGQFDILYRDFTMTRDGRTFFNTTSLSPLNLEISGSFSHISNIVAGTPSALITGQADAWMIPEPGSLALFGIGLLGMVGAFARRHKVQ